MITVNAVHGRKEGISMKKALFWDFDGTLVYPNERFVNTFLSAIRSCGFDASIEEIRSLFKAVYPWNHPSVDYADRTGTYWWDSFLGKLDVFYREHNILMPDAERINQCFKEQMIHHNTYTLYEDAKEVLAECARRGYRNYLLSNNYPELPLIVQDFGLCELFADLFVSANIGYEKPRQELFEYALRKAGYPECGYMIGDNPVADILGGKAAGLKTILVHRHDSADADHTCDTLMQIPELLA